MFLHKDFQRQSWLWCLTPARPAIAAKFMANVVYILSSRADQDIVIPFLKQRNKNFRYTKPF